ncbi:MAG: glucose-1-phosphate adenylyltransferase [Veillonellales bacterium]
MQKKECVAVVLAGGRGSRLNTLTTTLAKPAVPFGGRYRIIDFTLSNCYNSQLDTIGVLTQYRPFALQCHVEDGIAPELASCTGGVFILSPYLKDDGGEWYKGTANAVYQNIDFIDQYSPRYVLVLSGDHIYKMDYRFILQQHRLKQAEATISVIHVPWKDTSRFGIMNIGDDFRIHDFEEKPQNPRSNLASMGIYVFNWPILKQYLLADEKETESGHDFGKNIIPQMLQDGRKMFAYPFTGYWKDVGTVESFWQANMDLLGDEPLLALDDPLWPIYTVDSVQPPQCLTEAAITSQALIGDGCIVAGHVDHSVLLPGVCIASGAIVKNSVIMPNAKIGANSRIFGAIIGSGVSIAENCCIGCSSNEKITVIGEHAAHLLHSKAADDILCREDG